MPVAAFLSLALAAAPQTAAYQVMPPSAVNEALNTPPATPAGYPVLGNVPESAATPDKTLMPGQLHAFAPAARGRDFEGPFACADSKCKTRTPVFNAQTVAQREPDGRDHY